MIKEGFELLEKNKETIFRVIDTVKNIFRTLCDMDSKLQTDTAGKLEITIDGGENVLVELEILLVRHNPIRVVFYNYSYQKLFEFDLLTDDDCLHMEGDNGYQKIVKTIEERLSYLV